jgi:hypothetical protein
MIRHIVMLRVKATDGQSKQENARGIKAAIDGLKGIVPGLLRIEGGVDFSGTEWSSDVVLYSEFESRASLEAYQKHPAHVEALAFMADRRTERRVVDYEV